MSATLTPRSAASIALALREFGYPDVTTEMALAKGNRLLADGKYPSVDADHDIIDLFIAGMLRDAGLLKDER
jgi:hypothetical protein